MKNINFGRGGVSLDENDHLPPSENKRNWQLVNFCENDKYAIKSYCAIHHVDESLNLGDITKVDETKVGGFNMICGGSPCFVEGTLVLTENGYKQIEEIKVGDYVLTHKNRWQKVANVMTNEADKLYRIRSMPSEDIHCTPNHPFYVRERYRKWDEPNKKYSRYFKEPTWVEAKDLSRDYYIGTAINQKSELPKWDGVEKRVSSRGTKTFVENRLSEKFFTNEFWWVIGRYMGDGWTRSDGGIIICANDAELHQIPPYLDKLGWHYNIVKERTANKIHIPFIEIGKYCERFGKGAANKHLTADILNLPVDLLKSFIEGMISSDGHQDKQGMYKLSSVSRTLIYEFSQCIAKVYHRPFSIYFTLRPKTTVIEGRVVNQRDTYTVVYKLTDNVQDKAFYEDGYLWSPIHEVWEEEYNGLVYNLEVEEDHSYMAQNMIVHNCQDFSVAGQQKGSVWTCRNCGHEYNPLTVHWSERDKCPNCGSEDIEKTRSSLLVEFLRIIRGTRPNFGLYENVPNIVGKKFRETTFKLFEEELHEYGYNTYWQLLNSKDYGIPQNRNRLYLIFVKKDLDNGKFKFPEGFDNGLRLKDFLEDEVDEKFYIPDEKVKRFIANIKAKESPKPDTPQVMQVGNIAESKGWSNPQVGRIYSAEGVSPTLNTCGGGQREPKIVIDSQEAENNIRIRKLTPKEFFRLQGFGDEDYEVASKVCSNSQLRRQIGNSITVDVLYYIFVELYKPMPYLFDDLKLGSFFSGIGAPEKALDRLYESINSGNL